MLAVHCRFCDTQGVVAVVQHVAERSVRMLLELALAAEVRNRRGSHSGSGDTDFMLYMGALLAVRRSQLDATVQEGLLLRR